MMYTDYRIYNCILFNLISNAINHCPSNSKITIVTTFSETEEPGFSGKLSTKITNDGSVKHLKYQEEKANFKTFQMDNEHIEGERDLKTVGLGLSTAEALAFHLCGDLHLKSLKNL